MANDVIDIIIGKKAFEQLGQLDKGLQSNYANLLQLYELTQKFNNSGVGGSSGGSSNSPKRAVTELEKAQKALIATNEKLAISETAVVKELAKAREQLRQKNLENKRAGIENDKTASSYKRLSNQLNTLKAKYKDVATTEGVASKNAKQLRLQVIALDKSLKRIDESAGQFQRSVGNYQKGFKDVAAAEGDSTENAIRLRKELEKLDARVKSIDKSAGQFQRSVGNYPKGVSGFKELSSSALNFGRSLIGAFGAIEAIRLAWDFGKESLALARQAKGVEFAFERLGNEGEDAFERVKKSTRGLLSDLDIKKSLVEFDNFNLSLAESDTLFEFLAVRAAQTGQSVDKLKDSLVEGLSKESKLRIDNLGISAGELNEELEKTPDFVQAVANIAKREVKEAGNILDEAGNGAEKWAKAMENVQVAFGQFLSSGDFNILGFLAEKLDAVADSFGVLQKGLNTAKIAIKQFLQPFMTVVNQSPILSKLINGIVGAFKSFVDILFSPTFTYFGNFLTSVSFKLAGVGGVLSEVINRFRTFKNELTDLSSLDFSSPIALFNSVQTKFNNIVSKSTDFTKAYRDAQKDLAISLFEAQKAEENREPIDLNTNNNAKNEVEKEQKDYSYALAKARLEDIIAINEHIVDDENQTAKLRLQALTHFEETSVELAQLTRDKELAAAKGNNDAKELAYRNYERTIDEIQAERLKKLDSWVVDANDIMSEFGVEENIESPSFDDTMNSFAAFFGFDPEDMLKAWQDYVERMEKIGEEANLNGFFKDLKEGFTQADKQIKELAEQTGRELINTTNAIFDNRVQRYDDDIQRNNDYYAQILNNEQLTEQQRQQLEAERDAKNAEIERKKREQLRKQAIFNKIVSLAEIGISTAQAVMTNTKQLGLLPAIPVNALTIALGAAQAATVAATPIPRYKKGKKKGQGNDSVALVNDGGRDEIKVGADGTVTRYTGRNVLDYVQKDDTIYSSVAAFENAMLKQSLSMNYGQKQNQMIISSDGIREEIRKGMKANRPNIVNNITLKNDSWINNKMSW